MTFINIGLFLLVIVLGIVINYAVYILLEYERTIFKIVGYVVGNMVLLGFIFLLIGACILLYNIYIHLSIAVFIKYTHLLKEK